MITEHMKLNSKSDARIWASQYELSDSNEQRLANWIWSNKPHIGCTFYDHPINGMSEKDFWKIVDEEPDEISTAAATLGRKGGKSRSPAKVDAVRENGKKGGRPGYAERVEIDSSANRKLEREVRFGKVFWLVTIWPSGATLPSVPLSVKEFRRLKEAREYFELP